MILPKVYNTLTKKKDAIKPIKRGRINLFVCGPTVYDFSHIGHARIYIFFDCFTRYLQQIGFKVFYLQNITDVDDRIIQRSRERGVLASDLAKAFTKEHLKDMGRLAIKNTNKYAKATDYIKEIIGQVKRLLDKKYAYRLEDGIYFDISKFKNYGKLSGRTILQAEDSVSRIDYSKNKKNRGDFCLWKFSVEGEPSWPGPFGAGRPGWHIEDTAITEKFFGPQYDIHGGGIDLLFPHHEAEITQMEALSGKKPMAKYWMHVGFLTINGQKMSKSLGNFITIDGFLRRYPYRLLRFWIAKNLWHSPIDYSESAMIESSLSLERIGEFLRKIRSVKSTKGSQVALQQLLKNAKENFYKELADDFNTPRAFAAIFEFIKESNKSLEEGTISKISVAKISAFFKEVNSIFDIVDFKKLAVSHIPSEVKKIVERRNQFRKEKNWQKSDELRIELEKYGYSVDDTKTGTVLKRKDLSS